MLQITVPSAEYYDEENEVFINVNGRDLQLEHSLVSISKWESKWHKPYFSKEAKTEEEAVDYIRCMTLTQNVDQRIYNNLTPLLFKQIDEYIKDPMTATWFSKDDDKRPSREVITSELLYYQMISLNIPMECQKWHLNRLLTLIRVCGIKSGGIQKKKLSQSELMNRNRALNKARKKRLNTKG